MPEGLPSPWLWIFRAGQSNTSLMLVFKITFSFWNILDLQVSSKEGQIIPVCPLELRLASSFSV